MEDGTELRLVGAFGLRTFPWFGQGHRISHPSHPLRDCVAGVAVCDAPERPAARSRPTRHWRGRTFGTGTGTRFLNGRTPVPGPSGSFA